MRVEIRIQRSNLRRWHRSLADRLSRTFHDCDIRLTLVGGEASLPASVKALLMLEGMILRRARPTLYDPVAEADAGRQTPADFAPDLVFDCTGLDGAASAGASARILRPLYAGSASEEVLVASLLSGSMPDIVIEDVGSGLTVASGKPGSGLPGLSGGLEAVLSRTIVLLTSAARSPRPTPPAASSTPGRKSRQALAFAMRNIARDSARAIFGLCFHAPHWRVGWRMHDGPGVMERGDLGGPAWQVLPDPGLSFYADPFPVRWNGRTFLFIEELEHRIGKGVISALEFGPDGPVGQPVRVLEEPWHLSYPFVIDHAGSLYMVPEASSSGAVRLYRCVAFPHRWEPVATLLEGTEASDCTIFRHEGRFWMMSVTREGLGGYSDTLAIHYADDLFGPWFEHARSPALLDVGGARPGGRVVARNGRLWRPVQDCSAGYGRMLALAEIERLDTEDFTQTIRAMVTPGPLWPGRRLHTLNRVDRLECIDGAIHNPKLAWARPYATARMRPRPALDPESPEAQLILS